MQNFFTLSPQLDEFNFGNDEPLCKVAKAYAFMNTYLLNGAYASEVYKGSCDNKFQYENFRRHFDPVLACIVDGYEPCNWEKELYDKCAQVKNPEEK